MDLQEVKVSSKEIHECIKGIIDKIADCSVYAIPFKKFSAAIDDRWVLHQIDEYVKKEMTNWLKRELDEDTAVLRLRRRIEYYKQALKLDIHWMDHIPNTEMVRYIVSMCICPLIHYTHEAINEFDCPDIGSMMQDIHKDICENATCDDFNNYIVLISCFPDSMNIPHYTSEKYDTDDEFRKIFNGTIAETILNYNRIRLFKDNGYILQNLMKDYGMTEKQCKSAMDTFNELLDGLNFGQNVYDFIAKVITQAIVEAVKDQENLQKETIKMLCRKCIEEFYQRSLHYTEYSEKYLDFHINYVWNVYYEGTIEEEMKMAREEKQTEEELMRDHIIDMELQDEINGEDDEDEEDEEIRERESRIWDSCDDDEDDDEDEAYDEPADNDDFSDYLDSELKDTEPKYTESELNLISNYLKQYRPEEKVNIAGVPIDQKKLEKDLEDAKKKLDQLKKDATQDEKTADEKHREEAQSVVDKILHIFQESNLTDEDKCTILGALQKNAVLKASEKREFMEFMMRKSLEFANDIVSNATANGMGISSNDIRFVIDDGVFSIGIPTGIDDDTLYNVFTQQRDKLIEEETRAYERANDYDDE